MGMTNKEKIDILINRISNMNIHIIFLENDIVNNPNFDVEGKPTRQEVLEDYRSKKLALQDFMNTLTTNDFML